MRLYRRRSLPPKLRRAVLRRDQFLCQICAERLSETWCHMDHKIPLALGGSNAIDNFQALCPPCNLSKGASQPLGG
jgi:5-methylcytosine-specific restriction endonuclease McrA